MRERLLEQVLDRLAGLDDEPEAPPPMPGDETAQPGPRMSGLSGPFNTAAPGQPAGADGDADGTGGETASGDGSGELMSAGAGRMPRPDMALSKKQRARLLTEMYEQLADDGGDGPEPDFQRIAELFEQGDLAAAHAACDGGAAGPARPSQAPAPPAHQGQERQRPDQQRSDQRWSGRSQPVHGLGR